MVLNAKDTPTVENSSSGLENSANSTDKAKDPVSDYYLRLYDEPDKDYCFTLKNQGKFWLYYYYYYYLIYLKSLDFMTFQRQIHLGLLIFKDVLFLDTFLGLCNNPAIYKVRGWVTYFQIFFFKISKFLTNPFLLTIFFLF